MHKYTFSMRKSNREGKEKLELWVTYAIFASGNTISKTQRSWKAVSKR